MLQPDDSKRTCCCVVLCCVDLQKDGDQVTATVENHLNTFTQTGLAAGQQYTVTISGELDGQRGTQTSTQFITRECVSEPL